MAEILIITLLIIIALLSKAGRIRRNPASGANLSRIQSLILQRGISGIFMLPVLVYCVVRRPFWMEINTPSVVALVLIVMFVPLLSFLIVRPDQSSEPHEIYTGLQTGSFEWILYMISISVYMIVYEILLRGIVLYYLTDWGGIAVAITVNTLIYAAMHLVKNLREALFCIPLGVFICWITLYTNSIWPAAIFHLLMALCFELFYNAKRTHVNV